MRVSITISAAECEVFKEYFKNYGTVQPLLNETGMHRLTLTRFLQTRRATRDIVEKVRSHVKKQSISQQ